MPDVEPLTKAELAERATATPDRIDRLTELGITSAEPDGTYRPANLQRVRFAEAIERSGIDLEAVGKAITDGQLSFAFLDLFFDPVAYSSKTYREAAAERGWTVEYIQLIHEALGLPPPQPDAFVREDDLEMFSMSQFAFGLGMGEADVARVLRIYGENLYRITAAETPFYHAFVEQPLLRSGMSESQMLQASSEVSPQARAMVKQMILWLYRRHQEHEIMDHVVEHLENALEQAGLAPPRPERLPAMVFLDLVGYTRLTEERGDEVAADLVMTLAQLVRSESARFGGRPIKWLGDGVMFHFPDPDGAVRCSLDLVARTPEVGLPPAHVGVNAGPVIFRDGDYFGRTVNVAARIASRAGPGEVLASDHVADAVADDGVRFEQIGPVELKGLSRPVTLYRVTRP